jgi:hypothetical protein
MQHAFVEDGPELGGTRSVQNGLPGHTGGHLLLQLSQVPIGARAEDRAGVVRGLEQAGDDEGLIPAQDRGLGFDAGPFLEPAVQALLLALLQVLPQAGQGTAGVQPGAASRRGGKSWLIARLAVWARAGTESMPPIARGHVPE